MLAALLILQAAVAAPLPAAEPFPTIELRARVHADSIRVEREGEAYLTLAAEPVLARAVTVERSKPVPDAVTVRDVTLQLDARVTIDPAGGPPAVSIRMSLPEEEPPR